MAAPDISVIIPIFNRGEVIRYTLESVRRASIGLQVQIVVVDDGSAVPVAETLDKLGYAVTKLHRQENQGLLFARLAGLERATGRYILFLDSDDLITPKKLILQVTTMDACGADVSTTDTAHCILRGDFDSLQATPDGVEAIFRDSARFYIQNQPAPHGPVYRADYLRKIVSEAFIPPSPLYNPVAEIWFYYNAAARPAEVAYVSGPHTIIGTHADTRLTNHWENLAAASLAVMEAFARLCPQDQATLAARRAAGAKAFQSWRRLPRGFSPAYASRLLGIWKRLPRAELRALGGREFRALARVLGPEASARLLHYWQSRPYDSVRTMSDEDMARLLASLPSP